MALLAANGFEIGPGAATGGGGDSTLGTRNITTVRTGVASLTLGTGTATLGSASLPLGTGNTLFGSIWIYLPSGTGFSVSGSPVIQFGNARFVIDNSRFLQGQVWNGSSWIAAGAQYTTALAQDTWHQFEVKCEQNGAGSAYEFRLNGTSIASGTATINSGTTATISAIGTGLGNVYYDDLIVHDSTGASPVNSWPGDSRVIMMAPTQTQQNGSWTGGAGGTANLWTAINDLPPSGTASETDSTQIESVDTSPNNATDEFRASCGSYTSAGVTAGETVLGLDIICWHGEDIATGTKTGSMGAQSNPAGSLQTFTYGDDAGALGTWPTGWQVQHKLESAPTVTKGSNLILNVRKTDTGNRVASVCFLGAYVALQASSTAITMTGANTLANATSSASMQLGVVMSAAQTLGNATSSGTAVSFFANTMSAANTLAGATSSGAVQLGVNMAAANTLAGATSSGSATVGLPAVTMSAAQTLADATSIGTVQVGVNLSAAQTLAGATSNASMQLGVVLSAAQTLAGATSNGTAAVAAPPTFTAAQTLAGATSSATFQVGVNLSAANTLEGATSSATMSIAGPGGVTMSSAVTLAGATSTASAQLGVNLSSSVTLAGATSDASLTVTVPAVTMSAAVTLGDATSTGVSQTGVVMVSAPTLAGATSAGVFQTGFYLTAAQTLQGATSNGTMAVTALTTVIPVWNGSAYVMCEVRAWNGSAFVDVIATAWDGAEYVDLG